MAQCNSKGRVNKDSKVKKQVKIFISHSSNDKEYVKKIVEFLENMNVPECGIFCSSVAGYGVPGGNNIYEFLRKEFETYDLHMIFVLSKNYYMSSTCLNEMGAAWVGKNKCTAILLPQFSYDEIEGVISSEKVWAKIDDESMINVRLSELRDMVVSEFGLETISEHKWERIRDEFINNMLSLSSKIQEGEENTSPKSSTRFIGNIRDKKEIDLFSDYIKYSDISPITCGVNADALEISNYKDGFNMKVNTSNKIIDKNAFVMGLFKYTPSEKWSEFYDAGYYLNFDVKGSEKIKAFQLEIKSKNGEKIIDKKIIINKNGNHFCEKLSHMTRVGSVWNDITEICFTVFLCNAYVSGDEWDFSIENLKMIPEW